MILVLETQYRENYGAHEWDGIGEVPQYWKSKGGESYLVSIPEGFAENPHTIAEIAGKASAAINYSNDYSEEFVTNWHLESEGYQTRWELDQLEYDGAITSPSPRLDPVSFARIASL